MNLGLRPLTARSVIASVLLGSYPPVLAVKALVRVGELFGIAEGTIRVALSRMTADGELLANDGRYRLGAKLAARQADQDRGRWPEMTSWSGTWEIVVTAETGEAPDSAAGILRSLHLASTGDRTWIRPANLARPAGTRWPARCHRFEGRPAEGDGVEPDVEANRALVASLWDLGTWHGIGSELLGAYRAAADPAERFVVAAAILRHLRGDPLLPETLTDANWPADRLRATYEAFTTELHALMVSSVGH